MNKQEILIKKKRKILVEPAHSAKSDRTGAATFNAELMRLGFIVNDPKLLDLELFQLEKLYKEVIPVVGSLVGSHVQHDPFYPNFPQQVIDASDLELYLNALVHYWSFGFWRPEYEKVDRLPYDEFDEYKELELGSESDLLQVFKETLGSNASINDYDKKVVAFFLDEYPAETLVKNLPESIPFKENLCLFVKECLERQMNLVGMRSLKTATDILRVATHLSDGDISLAENTKFKSFKRPLRRAFVHRLNEVINPDDIFRHRGKWVRLAHSLHIGEYKKSASKAYEILSNARDKNYKHRGFYSKVENAIVANDIDALLPLLKSRPGEFARRLDHILRRLSENKAIGVVKVFGTVADQVDTRVLLQLLGHMNTRTTPVTKRVIFPKGSLAKAQLVRKELPEINERLVTEVVDVIVNTLHQRFAKLDPLPGRVFISKDLESCPIPLSMRSASDSLCTVARGTQIPFGSDKNTIRLFIYWKGMDIDLSASLCDKNFNEIHQVSWTQLRAGGGLLACHSGDITRAPNGASEFIDVDIERALSQDVRYIVMQVYVFSGPNFSEHEICFAGWMLRDNPNSGEVFEPKSVQQKLDVTSNSKTCIPVVFDLVDRKAIWMDLASKARWTNAAFYGRSYGRRRANTLEDNRATTKDLLEASVSLENKPVLSDLFYLHGEARGEIVLDRNEADVVYSWDGDIKPSDVGLILSEYLK